MLKWSKEERSKSSLTLPSIRKMSLCAIIRSHHRGRADNWATRVKKLHRKYRRPSVVWMNREGILLVCCSRMHWWEKSERARERACLLWGFDAVSLFVCLPLTQEPRHEWRRPGHRERCKYHCSGLYSSDFLNEWNINTLPPWHRPTSGHITMPSKGSAATTLRTASPIWETVFHLWLVRR